MYVNYDILQVTSQSLDPQTTNIHDVILKHDCGMDRIVPISTHDNKGYYVMTESLESGTIFCSSKKITLKNNKNYYVHEFRLRIKNQAAINTNCNLIKIDPCESPSVDPQYNHNILKNPYHADFDGDDMQICVPQSVQTQIELNGIEDVTRHKEVHIDDNSNITNNNDNYSKTLIDKLSNYQRGLTDRIRYIMMIPEYKDKKSFQLHLSTIKLDGKIKYKNIIEYQNKKNNFTYDIVKNVLMNCRYRLLLKIRYLLITNNNVIMNIQLVRIFPENLDTLQSIFKLMITSELNAFTIRNLEKYNELNTPTNTHNVTKQKTKDSLKKLLKI